MICDMSESPRWAGVDVGAKKGFAIAVVDEAGLAAEPTFPKSVAEVITWLQTKQPLIVAVDSPIAPAPTGDRSRQGERDLVKATGCHLRYTPNIDAMTGNAYYDWIFHGFALYKQLQAGPFNVIECFPTATWSRLGGRKMKMTRAQWSSKVLESLGLAGVPSRMNQDARDAIGAAITARLHTQGKTERFGDIWIPV